MFRIQIQIQPNRLKLCLRRARTFLNPLKVQELEKELETLKTREQRKKMDPWSAICTANEQELDEVDSLHP
jgi:hypothetical protein